MALGKYTLALSDYEYVSCTCWHRRWSPLNRIVQVKKVCPNDKDATVKYEECKKIVTQIRFQKAIAVDESSKSVANQIEIHAMCASLIRYLAIPWQCSVLLAVESEYDGPHLDSDGQVTKEFMFALLPYFENQKKLHKKYAYQVETFSPLSLSLSNNRFHLDNSANSDIAQIITELDRHHCTKRTFVCPTRGIRALNAD